MTTREESLVRGFEVMFVVEAGGYWCGCRPDGYRTRVIWRYVFVFVVTMMMLRGDV